MAYFDSFDKEIWHNLGLSYNMFQPHHLTEDEVRRSLEIADEVINNYKQRTLSQAKTMSLGDVLRSSATVYFDLGMHQTAKKAVSILKDLQYMDNMSDKEETLTVQSMIDSTGARLCKKPIYIEVPRKFTSTSIHFMAHEIAHILKESNPYECMGVHTDLEVIPILIEMISAHNSGDNNVFKKRELIMLDIASSFKKLHQDRINNEISDEDMLAFNTCYRQNILYLNSFYYSLKLFCMYLDDPNFILSIIDEVFNQKLTTSDIINYYCNNDSYSLQDGLNEFRNKLK